MMGKFCTYTVKKIRPMGYAPERTGGFAGFFFTSKQVLWGIMGVQNVRLYRRVRRDHRCKENLFRVTEMVVACPPFPVCAGTLWGRRG
jgi:hypothetical protein